MTIAIGTGTAVICLILLGSRVGFRRLARGLRTLALIVVGALFLVMTGAVLGLAFRSAIIGL